MLSTTRYLIAGLWCLGDGESTMKPSVSNPLSVGLVFAIALAAAFAVGAWQGLHTPQALSTADAEAQRSVFVQSGGVAVEPDRSVPDAAQALMHAHVPTRTEAAAATF